MVAKAPQPLQEYSQQQHRQQQLHNHNYTTTSQATANPSQQSQGSKPTKPTASTIEVNSQDHQSHPNSHYLSQSNSHKNVMVWISNILDWTWLREGSSSATSFIVTIQPTAIANSVLIHKIPPLNFLGLETTEGSCSIIKKQLLPPYTHL